MTSPRPISSLLALLVCACGGPPTQDLALQTIAAQVTVAPSSGVADPLGGAMLIDASGQPVRVRADGSQSTLESHPSNPAPPGFARALWALGPHSALVAAGGGLYLAQNGWLIAPPWRDAVPAEGVVGAADALDGTAWIGHRDGLFRLSGGQLAELKLGGSSATGLTHLAFAVNAAGKPSLWFARPNRLGTVTALGDGQYEVKEEGLPGGKSVQALVALGPSTTRPAELWLLTDSSLHRFVDGGWKGIDFGAPPDLARRRGPERVDLDRRSRAPLRRRHRDLERGDRAHRGLAAAARRRRRRHRLARVRRGALRGERGRGAAHRRASTRTRRCSPTRW